ncbi:MAG: DNA repair protein RecN [Ruminococcaceae bacterium]|nr:DNA repair protein RecN [Oscillospiraceae bacterium]
MLSQLHIENIAVIESADITFDEGFHVLTGETGAGKSIVVDSIGAVLGARTSRDLVRTGADRARVTALFRDLSEKTLLALSELGVEPDEDGCLLISREIAADGRGTCRIGGKPATAAILRAMAPHLINIHGQHDSQQLLDDASHIRYLDAFARADGVLAEYRGAYSAHQKLLREIEALSMDEAEKARRMDMLRYQIAQLERANLKEGEDDELETRRRLLANAEHITQAISEANDALYGEDDGGGAVAAVWQAARAVERAARYDESLEARAVELNDIAYRLEDSAREVMAAGDGLGYSQRELDDIQSRLETIRKLSKRYGGTVADMLAFLDRCREELDQMQYADDRRAHLESQAAHSYDTAYRLALRLSDCREAAAKTLETRIRDELTYLDMPRAVFLIQVAHPEEERPPLTADGLDRVSFLISVNAGEEPKPLSRVASGGELSRVMLAIKNVLAEGDGVNTLVFDEVDTGISGRAAQKVARKLAQVARGRQVLCVTHLTQIAAMADRQLLIEKAEQNGRAFTRITALDLDGRVRELSRISAGEVVTDATLAAAREMIRDAEEYKKTL